MGGEATYLPARAIIVGKRVNGGPHIAMGSYKTEAEAEAAIEGFRAFHMERCPNDRLEFSKS